jgi:hypothetical protein
MLVTTCVELDVTELGFVGGCDLMVFNIIFVQGGPQFVLDGNAISDSVAFRTYMLIRLEELIEIRILERSTVVYPNENGPLVGLRQDMEDEANIGEIR